VLDVGEQAGAGVVDEVDEAEFPGRRGVMSPIDTGMSPLPAAAEHPEWTATFEDDPWRVIYRRSPGAGEG
jgi:hypothetical protein